MPQFSIQSISVVGAQKVPAGLVSAYAQSVLHDGSHHFFSRQNIFAYPRAVIGKDIATSFPRIKSANVSRASLLATAVTVTIAEREPYALWCADETGACYVLDDSGFVFATAEGATPSTPYIFKGGLTYAMSSTSPSELNPIGHVFASSHLPGLVVLLQLLGQAGLAPTGARVESEQDFTVVFQEGFVLKAAFGEDVGALARDTALVLASAPLKGKGPQIEYIDLRFGNRVYYKLFSGGESAFGGKGETAASSTTN
jgi:cell division septal protein FtsQ